MVLKFLTALAALILAGPALAQSPVTPQDIMARVAETQKEQARLESEIRILRALISAQVGTLKTWMAANAEQRILEWRMVATKVETGFFAHDIVARQEVPGIETRCQLAATDDNKNLASQFPLGTEFTCIGTLGAISPSPELTTITLRQSKAVLKGGVAALYPQPNISLRDSIATTSQVQASIDTFVRACMPLFTTHASDIVSVRASASKAFAPFRVEQWGWDAEVHLTVELKERTATFPPEARANGHILHYFLGGGSCPGAQVHWPAAC